MNNNKLFILFPLICITNTINTSPKKLLQNNLKKIYPTIQLKIQNAIGLKDTLDKVEWVSKNAATKNDIHRIDKESKYSNDNRSCPETKNIEKK